jgi:hypothetical protein
MKIAKHKLAHGSLLVSWHLIEDLVVCKLNLLPWLEVEGSLLKFPVRPS